MISFYLLISQFMNYYTDYNKIQLYEMVLFNFIRSTIYKRCMEVDFIQKVKL